jgi:hypothetical protein
MRVNAALWLFEVNLFTAILHNKSEDIFERHPFTGKGEARIL